MQDSQSIAQLKAAVFELDQQEPNISVAEIAMKMNTNERDVTLALPENMVSVIGGSYCQKILESLPEWGKVTTIIHSSGSIFEIKAPFPKGKVGHGYYNLVGGKNGELHGHLKIDLITDVAFVSKPFHGTETHFIGFYDQAGDCVFKIYLGRDKKRKLIPEQIDLFKAMQKELSNG